MNSYRNAWKISLVVIVIITLVFTISSFSGFDLPDALIRIFGVLDLAAVVVLVFTSIRLKNGR